MNDHTQAPLPSAPRHRIGQVVRMLSATVFLVSLAATCYLSLLAPVFGPRTIPDTWALAVVVLALLTAPLGWRAIARLFVGRPVATLRFFRASPLTLGLAFALAAAYFALAPRLDAAQAAFTLSINTALVLQAIGAAATLLALCTLLAVPLILLGRLLGWGGGWLWRRMSAH